LALRLADAADAISLARFRSRDLVVETKPDLTPVTEADREVEHELRAMLGAQRGPDAIRAGEQRAPARAAPPRREPRRGAGRVRLGPATVDHRPDRRDAELLARGSRLGDADRA